MKYKIKKDKKNIIFKKTINYIFNKIFFYKKTLNLIYPILDPRIETEFILFILKKILKKNFTIIELGYGSNNLSSNIKFLIENLNILNIDILIESYIEANININKKQKLTLNSWMFTLKNILKTNTIITNPPYICKKELILINNIYNKKSLFSKNKGLNEIKKIIKYSYKKIFLNNNIIIEQSYKQSLKKYLKIYGFINIYTYNDYLILKRNTYAEK